MIQPKKRKHMENNKLGIVFLFIIFDGNDIFQRHISLLYYCQLFIQY